MLIINLIIWLSYSKRILNNLKYRNELKLALNASSNSEKAILESQINDFDMKEEKYRKRICIYIIVVTILEVMVSIVNSALNDAFNDHMHLFPISIGIMLTLHSVSILTTCLLLWYIKDDKKKRMVIEGI